MRALVSGGNKNNFCFYLGNLISYFGNFRIKKFLSQEISGNYYFVFRKTIFLFLVIKRKSNNVDKKTVNFGGQTVG